MAGKLDITQLRRCYIDITCMRRFLFSVVLLCLLPSMALAATDSITLQLKWKHAFQFAGYYAAIEQGYYRDAGLDVHLREATPGKNPIHAVIHGEAEYGVGTSELLLERAQGSPVVVLGVIFQHSPLVLITHADATVSDIHALAGKRIMLEINGSEVVVMLQRAGLSPGSYQRVEHSFRLEPWLQGRVAAMSAYITDEPYALSQRGMVLALENHGRHADIVIVDCCNCACFSTQGGETTHQRTATVQGGCG